MSKRERTKPVMFDVSNDSGQRGNFTARTLSAAVKQFRMAFGVQTPSDRKEGTYKGVHVDVVKL